MCEISMSRPMSAEKYTEKPDLFFGKHTATLLDPRQVYATILASATSVDDTASPSDSGFLLTLVFPIVPRTELQ